VCSKSGAQLNNSACFTLYAPFFTQMIKFPCLLAVVVIAVVKGDILPPFDMPTPSTEICPPGEQFNQCSSMCESKCGDDPFAPCIMMCGPPACQCMQGYSRDVNGRCIPREQCPKVTETCASYGKDCQRCLTNGCMMTGESGSCEENWPIADISMYVASSATEASAVCARRAREKERQDGCAAISSCEECKASKYDCMFGSWSTNEAPFCSVGCTGFCPPMVEAKCDAPVTGQCPPGEQFTTCSTMCESTCGTPFMSCIAMCGPPKCQCMSGYSRDVNGRCIPRDQCPKVTVPCTSGPNGMPNMCSTPCLLGEEFKVSGLCAI
jgi:hypothetical protein